MSAGDLSAAPLELAERYLEIERPEEALAALARATPDEDPERYHLLRAEAHLLAERPEAARDAAALGLAVEPESIPLLLVRSCCHERLGELAAAEESLLGALRQLPNEPALLCRYGRLVARGGQLDKARRLLAEARRVDPDSREAARLAMLLDYLAGDDRAAAEGGRRLLADDPEDSHGVAMLGLTLLERGDHGAAREVVVPAAALDPERLGGLAREARIRTHPLLWPLWPLQRFGSVPVWFGAVGLILVTGRLASPRVSSILALTYLAWCVYSWVVPPLLRRWVVRRGR